MSQLSTPRSAASKACELVLSQSSDHTGGEMKSCVPAFVRCHLLSSATFEGKVLGPQLCAIGQGHRVGETVSLLLSGQMMSTRDAAL